MLQGGIPPGAGHGSPLAGEVAESPKGMGIGNLGLESRLLVMLMALGGPGGSCDAGPWAVGLASRWRQELSDGLRSRAGSLAGEGFSS